MYPPCSPLIPDYAIELLWFETSVSASNVVRVEGELCRRSIERTSSKLAKRDGLSEHRRSQIMEAVPAVCTLISLHEKTEPYRKDSDWTVMLQTAMNQLQVFEYLNGRSLVMNRPIRRWPPS